MNFLFKVGISNAPPHWSRNTVESFNRRHSFLQESFHSMTHRFLHAVFSNPGIYINLDNGHLSWINLLYHRFSFSRKRTFNLSFFTITCLLRKEFYLSLFNLILKLNISASHICSSIISGVIHLYQKFQVFSCLTISTSSKPTSALSVPFQINFKISTRFPLNHTQDLFNFPLLENV